MLVRKGSWHYGLVKHKDFVNDPDKDREGAIGYIMEVWLAIFTRCGVGLTLILALVLILSSQRLSSFIKIHPEPLVAVIVLLASPIWITILLLAINPFTRKSWRKLEIID